jgi:hypothetical protein
MNVISLKDYAKQNNVTYEAVRQQVIRYADELGEHIIRDGRQQLLDEEAVAFLDAKRQKNPVVIIQQDKDEIIEQLRKEKEQLLTKIASQADKISELSEWKSDNAVAIAESNHRQQLLEDGEKKIELLEAQNASLSDENARIDREAQEAQKTAQRVVDELTAVYESEKKRLEDEAHLLLQRAEAAEKRNKELENRNLGDYLKGLFRKKGK